MDFLNDLTGLQKSRGMYFKWLMFYNQFLRRKILFILLFCLGKWVQNIKNVEEGVV